MLQAFFFGRLGADEVPLSAAMVSLNLHVSMRREVRKAMAAGASCHRRTIVCPSRLCVIVGQLDCLMTSGHAQRVLKLRRWFITAGAIGQLRMCSS